jgi:hemerythrin-like domain-containing protein
MKVTEELKAEHRAVEVILGVLGAISEDLEKGGAVNAGDMEEIIEFLSVFVDQCHHGKEEDFLFPALTVSGLARASDMARELCAEHEEAREIVGGLEGLFSAYKKGDEKAASGIKRAIEEYRELLVEHINKEDTLLFPMAEEKLGAIQDDELAVNFEKLEEERIGPGRHEAFHELLDRLNEKYGA